MYCLFFIFFFNDTATTEIYTLSLHDALPILSNLQSFIASMTQKLTLCRLDTVQQEWPRSEERFSRNAETDLVCRLLLEKKKEAGLQTAQLPSRERPDAERRCVLGGTVPDRVV